MSSLLRDKNWSEFRESSRKLGELVTTILTSPTSSWAQNGESYFGKVLKTLERQEEDENCKCRICDVETVNGPEG